MHVERCNDLEQTRLEIKTLIDDGRKLGWNVIGIDGLERAVKLYSDILSEMSRQSCDLYL